MHDKRIGGSCCIGSTAPVGDSILSAAAKWQCIGCPEPQGGFTLPNLDRRVEVVEHDMTITPVMNVEPDRRRQRASLTWAGAVALPPGDQGQEGRATASTVGMRMAKWAPDLLRESVAARRSTTK
jgi:hypothetical protein